MNKNIDLHNKHILISRTDSIGDVVLSLPICVWLKKEFPTCKITFLGKKYTKAVLSNLSAIDAIECWDEWEELPVTNRVEHIKSLEIDVFLHVFPNKDIASLARKAKIPNRIGTSHRSYHLLTCNIRPNFTRKNSPLHESQLNFELLRPFGLKEIPSMEVVNTFIQSFQSKEMDLPTEIKSALSDSNKKIILHPKSQGSAMEWPIEKYMQLAEKLNAVGHTVFFTGTEKEGLMFRNLIPLNTKCIDTTGKLSLEELIYFISQTDCLLACSTGPLHISGALNKKTIGLFSAKKPIHPGRWHALGNNTVSLVQDEKCPACLKNKPCNCIHEIEVDTVLKSIS